MSQASRDAYAEIRPGLSTRQEAVYHAMWAWNDFHGPITCRNLAKKLNLPRDSISPRVGELKNKGLVREIGRAGRETIYEPCENTTAEAVKPRKHRLYRNGVMDASQAINKFMIEKGVLFSQRMDAVNAVLDLLS